MSASAPFTAVGMPYLGERHGAPSLGAWRWKFSHSSLRSLASPAVYSLGARQRHPRQADGARP